MLAFAPRAYKDFLYISNLHIAHLSGQTKDTVMLGSDPVWIPEKGK